MVIKDIQLEYTSMNGFCSQSIDLVRHVKVLPYLSVVQAVEGYYDITLSNGQPHNTGSGGFFVAPSNIQQAIVHNVDRATGQMTCRWVFLKVKINGVYYLDELYDFPTVLSPSETAQMNAVFQALFETEDVADRYIGYYQIIKLLLSVGREKEHPLPSYIGHATSYIRQHYTEKVTVRGIAEQVGLSESHVFAVFKQQMGMSPITYLNQYRLSLAVDLLLQTDRTVTEIAASVGIYDAVYFNKLFRKNYQMSPTAYRNTYAS